MARPTPRPYTVLLPDLENYSSGGWPRHMRLQDGLRSVLDEACAETEMQRPQWKRQGTGDGELALLPSNIPKYRILSLLVPELAVSLAEFNMDKSPGYRLRMRLAIDHGDVQVNDEHFAGDPPIRVARLCNSPDLRAALRSAPKDLAVIVSERFHAEVVADGPPGVDPTTYRKVRVAEKTFAEDAWIHVPGGTHSESTEDVTAGNTDPGHVAPVPVAPEPSEQGGVHVSTGRIESSGALSLGGTAHQTNYGSAARGRSS